MPYSNDVLLKASPRLLLKGRLRNDDDDDDDDDETPVGPSIWNKYLGRNSKLNVTSENPNRARYRPVDYLPSRKQLQLVAWVGFEPGATQLNQARL